MLWRGPVSGVTLAIALGLAVPSWAWADCDPEAPRDTPEALAADCDEDGWTPAQGDCDDFDPTVHPGAPKICGDRKDNDCNGYIDEGCDSAWTRSSLEGGAGCAGGAPAASAGFVLFLPLLLMGRRR